MFYWVFDIMKMVLFFLIVMYDFFSFGNVFLLFILFLMLYYFMVLFEFSNMFLGFCFVIILVFGNLLLFDFLVEMLLNIFKS